MVDESFSQRCSVGDSTPDYGYGDTTAAPTPDYGYGDTTAAPTPDYGYGDTTAAPDTTAKLGYVSPDSNDLGYGSTHSNNQYGYGNDNDNDQQQQLQQQQEEQKRRERPRRRGSITKYSLDAQHEVQQQECKAHQPHADSSDAPVTDTSNTSAPDKYGYGDSSKTPADKYGYGDTSNTTTDKYGYGDTSNTSEDKCGHGGTNDLGYGDTNAHGGGSTASEQIADSQRHRPRRRGSITKFSLEATKTVANEEYQDQAAPPLYQECSVPMSDGTKSCDGDAMSHDGDAEDVKKKKTKGGRFSRLRGLGRNSSHSASSKDSSKDSRN
jgi:hypothetical protein